MWHIGGVQQVCFQWLNELLLCLSLSYQTLQRREISVFRHFACMLGTFTYCLFPPFGKMSELLKTFYLCNLELFGEFVWENLTLKWGKSQKQGDIWSVQELKLKDLNPVPSGLPLFFSGYPFLKTASVSYNLHAIKFTTI